jgi:hypothetical protein
LEVDAAEVGLVGKTINGFAWTLHGGRIFASGAGKCQNPCASNWNNDGNVWVDTTKSGSANLPPVNDPSINIQGFWDWQTYSEPGSPIDGAVGHWSDSAAQMHQSYFYNAMNVLTPIAGDKLYTWIVIDPNDPPQEVMLQWLTTDGMGWDHRAFWGKRLIDFNGVISLNESPANHQMSDVIPTTKLAFSYNNAGPGLSHVTTNNYLLPNEETLGANAIRPLKDFNTVYLSDLTPSSPPSNGRFREP